MSRLGSTNASRAYVTVKIPASLASLIDDYLMSDDAAVRGLRSRSGVVTAVMVEFLERKGFLDSGMRRFTHVNTCGGCALIRDNLAGVTAWVSFSLPDRVYCELCESSDLCDHVRYALTLEKVRLPLEAAGFRLAF